MANNSNFILNNIVIDDYKVLDSGTLVLHNDEAMFNFEKMPIKLKFKNTWLKKKPYYELKDDFNLILYNMNSVVDISTVEYFLIASWVQDNKVCEKLYISFSVSGEKIKTFHYTFFTKVIINGN